MGLGAAHVMGEDLVAKEGIDLNPCRTDCEFYKPGIVFELCHHEHSQYRAVGRVDWHTITHQRTVGACGPQAADYRRKKRQ